MGGSYSYVRSTKTRLTFNFCSKLTKNLAQKKQAMTNCLFLRVCAHTRCFAGGFLSSWGDTQSTRLQPAQGWALSSTDGWEPHCQSSHLAGQRAGCLSYLVPQGTGKCVYSFEALWQWSLERSIFSYPVTYRLGYIDLVQVPIVLRKELGSTQVSRKPTGHSNHQPTG